MQSVKIFLLSLSLWLLGTTASAEYHHVDDCTTCHWWVDPDGTMVGDNAFAIRKLIPTPNSGYKEVVFNDANYLDDNYTNHADGDANYNGICEVCHTVNNHHRNDGSDNTAHFDGQRCTSCHLHTNEFAPPVQQAHRTHLDYRGKGPLIQDCTVCHTPPIDTDPNYQYSNDVNTSVIFRDGQPLETTTACDNCHSPWGQYPGGDPATALLNPTVGAKANFRTGMYESDGYTLKPGKEKWCITCHDDRPSTSKYDSSPDAPPPTLVLSYLNTTDGGTGWATDVSYAGTVPFYKTGAWGVTDWIKYNPFTIGTSGTYRISMKWYAATNLTTCTSPGQELLVEVNSTGGSYDSVRWLQPSGSVDYLQIAEFNITAGDVTLKLTKDLAGCFPGAGDIKVEPTGGSGGSVIFAPMIAGDNDTWGFYATGHGVANVHCTECHDPRKKHIDYNYRTHDINATSGAVINGWGDSYRLQSKDPKSGEAICARCHDFRLIWDEGSYATTRVGQTGLRKDWDGENGTNGGNNIHQFHMVQDLDPAVGGQGADSDWDGITDSDLRCANCHNVHGSTRGRMFRDGHLVSDPYTTSMMPMKDSEYAIYAKANWQPLLQGGDYNVSIWYPAVAGAATNSKFYVKSSKPFLDKFTVDQTINTDTWFSLGTFNFEAGDKGFVFANNKLANGSLIADAVRFKSATEDIIVDNGDANYTRFSVLWATSTASGNGGDYDSVANNGRGLNVNPFEVETTSVRIPGVLGADIVDNKLCYSCHGGSNVEVIRPASNMPKVLNRFEAKRWVMNDGTEDAVVYITAQDTDSNISSVTLDLTSIGGTVVNMTWVEYQTYMYTIPAALINGLADVSYKLPVIATDTDGNSAESETYLFPKAGADTVYMDTNEVELYDVNDFRFGVNYIDTNSAYPAHQVYFGPGYRYTSDVDAYATGYGTWTPRIPKNGKYEVYGFWNNAGNSVKYTAYAANGTYEVIKDQNVNPSQWNIIGTYSFLDDQSNYIHQISNDGTAMVADAMKFVRVNAEPIVRLSSAYRIDGTFRKSRYFAGTEMATITARAFDYDSWDPLSALTYDWSGTDAAILNAANIEGFYGEDLSFVPNVVAPGVYKIEVAVTDSQGATTTTRLMVRVLAAAPRLLSGTDTDGDGINDDVDGWWDNDEDGIPNYLDANLSAYQIPDGGTLALETEKNLFLRIGTTAFFNESSDGIVTLAEVTGNGDDGVGGINGSSAVGGLFDFDIIGLKMTGMNAKVVLPLQGGATLPAGAVYQKYIGGVWQDFVINADNKVYSSLKAGGVCPAPGDAAYSIGLTAGHECVQLLIQDGGPNDADGLANAEIKDPGAIIVPQSSSGGSGSIGPWMLLLLGMLTLCAGCIRRKTTA